MSDDLKLQAQARALAPYLRTLVFTPFWDGGTYAPTYDGAVSGATTYTTQSARWVRLGNIAIVRGQVVWTAAAGTGNARVSLPKAAAAATGGAAGDVRLNSVTFANSAPTPFVTGGASYFELSSPLTNAAEGVVQTEAAGNIQFEIIYEV